MFKIKKSSYMEAADLYRNIFYINKLKINNKINSKIILQNKSTNIYNKKENIIQKKFIKDNKQVIFYRYFLNSIYDDNKNLDKNIYCINLIFSNDLQKYVKQIQLIKNLFSLLIISDGLHILNFNSILKFNLFKLNNIIEKNHNYFQNGNSEINNFFNILKKQSKFLEDKKHFIEKKNLNNFLISPFDINNFFLCYNNMLLSNIHSVSACFFKNLLKNFVYFSHKNFLRIGNILQDNNFKVKIIDEFFDMSKYLKLLLNNSSWKQLSKKKILNVIFNDQKQIKLVLDSKYLGSLLVYLKISDNKSIKLDLLTDSKKATEILTSNIPNLRDILLKYGMSFSSINININSNNKMNIVKNIMLNKKNSVDNSIVNDNYYIVSKNMYKNSFSSSFFNNNYNYYNDNDTTNIYV